MAYCSGCGSKKESCSCEKRSRSRERNNAGSEGVATGRNVDTTEDLLKRLAENFTKTTLESKNEILQKMTVLQAEVEEVKTTVKNVNIKVDNHEERIKTLEMSGTTTRGNNDDFGTWR